MKDRLEVGEVIPALIIDGIPDTPYVSGALRLDADRGVELTIPYVRDEPQFASVQEWSRTQAPPEHLSIRAHGVRWELFDCQFSGYRESGHEVSELHIAAGEAVLGERDGQIGGSLAVDEVESEIDGLYEWARLSAVSMDATSVGEGRERSNTATYTVAAATGLMWKQGDATVSISITWAGRDARGIAVDERAVLTSKFDEPRSFFEHLIEQRKFSTFLSFLFGAPTPFRRHRVRDDLFTQRTLGGNVIGYPHVDVISRQTIREQLSAAAPGRRYDHPIARQSELDPSALSMWADNYEDWSRFILPIAGTYRLSTTLVDERGQCRHESRIAQRNGRPRRRRRADVPSRVEDNGDPCLSRHRTPSDPLGRYRDERARTGSGYRAQYNAIKHPDRGAFPDPVDSRVLSEISMVIVRLNAVRLVTGDDEIASRSSAVQQFLRPRQILADEGLIIEDDGHLVTREPPQ